MPCHQTAVSYLIHSLQFNFIFILMPCIQDVSRSSGNDDDARCVFDNLFSIIDSAAPREYSTNEELHELKLKPTISSSNLWAGSVGINGVRGQRNGHKL